MSAMQSRQSAPPADERAVDQQRVFAPRRLDRVAQRLLEIGAERRELVRRERDAGRHGVAAALDQQAARDRVAHRARRDRRRRSSGRSRCRCRPARARSRRPAGRSAPSAAPRPARPRRDASPARRVTTTAPFSSMPSAAIASASASATRLLLDRLALAVEPVEFGRDARRLRAASLLEQQPHAEIGAADAPARIDARPEQEAEMPGFRRPGRAAPHPSARSGRHARAAASRSGPWRRRRG